MEYVMTLLFAVHYQWSDTVELLLRHGTKVPEEAIYIAVHRPNTNILRLLLKTAGRINIDSMKIINKNNALIVAAKKGFHEAVRCLIDIGYDVTLRNERQLSALDRAVTYNHENICEMLLHAGAPSEIRASKFKRTPLHTAVDIGSEKITKMLLEHGASVITRDHKGFYPIHTAVFRNHKKHSPVIAAT